MSGDPFTRRDEPAAGPWRQNDRLAAMLFVLLAAMALTTLGIFNSVLKPWHIVWNEVLLGAACLVVGIEIARGALRSGRVPAPVWAAFAWAALVLTSALMHRLALSTIGLTEPVNAIGIPRWHWEIENRKFAEYYLFMPVLFAANWSLLRRLSGRFVIAVTTSLLAVSMAVCLVQEWIDPTLLLKWNPLKRDGLASDPNALALTALLAAPVAAVLASSTRGRARAAWFALNGLLWMAIYLAGSRSVLAATLLVTVAVSVWQSRQQSGGATRAVRRWAAAGALPVALAGSLVAAALVEPRLPNIRGVSRLVDTWQRFDAGGMSAVFNQGELRGHYAAAAVGLAARAPLGGWGPGGFYREFPNQEVRLGRPASPAVDSPLNHYLILLVDFGLLGALVASLLVIVPVWAGYRALGRVDPVRRRMLASVVAGQVVFLAVMAVLPATYFPDVVWLWSLQLAWLCHVASEHGRAAPAPVSPAVLGVAFAGLWLVFAVFATPTTLGHLGYLARTSVVP